jgi:Holliday junction resolvase
MIIFVNRIKIKKSIKNKITVNKRQIAILVTFGRIFNQNKNKYAIFKFNSI